MKQVLHLLALGIALALMYGTIVPARADDLVMLGDAEELAVQGPTSRLLLRRYLMRRSFPVYGAAPIRIAAKYARSAR